MQPQAEERLLPPEAGRGKEGSLLKILWRNTRPCPRPDFALLASRKTRVSSCCLKCPCFLYFVLVVGVSPESGALSSHCSPLLTILRLAFSVWIKAPQSQGPTSLLCEPPTSLWKGLLGDKAVTQILQFKDLEGSLTWGWGCWELVMIPFVCADSLWSCLTLQPYGLEPTRFLCAWDFSGQEYWSGLPHPPPRDLPDPGIEPESLMSPPLTGGFFTPGATWEARELLHKWPKDTGCGLGGVAHTVSRLQWESFHPDVATVCAPCGFLFMELPSKCPPTELPKCNWLMGIPWQSSGEDSAPSLLRGQSQSPVSPLRAYKPSGQKKQQRPEQDWLRR